MFELPQAKRVKRSDLFDHDQQDDDPHSGTEDESNTKTKRHAGNSTNAKDKSSLEINKAGPEYGFTYEYVDTYIQTSVDQVDDENDKSYDFNLFRPAVATESREQKQRQGNERDEALLSSEGSGNLPSKSPKSRPGQTPSQPAHPEPSVPYTSPTQTKVTISARSPTPDTAIIIPPPIDLQKAGLVAPRPQSHYVTWHLPQSDLERKKAEYEAAALTLEDIMAVKGRRWPGCALGWREIYIHPSRLIDRTRTKGAATSKGEGVVGDVEGQKRERAKPRPSKKQRIKARKVIQTKKLAARTAEEKEAAEREKRNAKNRAQKVKRRAKERERKALARAGDAEEGCADANGNGRNGGADVEPATSSP